jgi:molybdopterin synthase sulfur carrier subunit
VPAGTRIAQLWPLLVPDQPLPENVLTARNMEYVQADTIVRNGDEIAFFPPVTGGCE